MNRLKGTVCVYRESSQRETLSAYLKLQTGQTIYWNRCPKCFDDLIVNGSKNKVDVELTLSTKNNELSRPRNVVKLTEPY